MYQDNNFKTIALINKNIELPKVLNALWHCSLGLTNKTQQWDYIFQHYQSKEWFDLWSISQFPYIVLKSPNSSQIKTTLIKLIDQNIPYCSFTGSMIWLSSEQQQATTQDLWLNEQEFYCITCFWSSEILHTIFKKFSLYK